MEWKGKERREEERRGEIGIGEGAMGRQWKGWKGCEQFHTHTHTHIIIIIIIIIIAKPAINDVHD